jgi:CRP-like cAMP-binding protein
VRADAASDASDNDLLAALPLPALERWLPQLEPLELAAGEVLHEAGHPPCHAYFPLSAVASLLLPTQDGRCDEVAAVGREGIVGSSLFLDSGSWVLRAVVQSPGRMLRMRAEQIKAECAASVAVMRLLLQYTLAQSAEIAQGVVCGRHHTVQQRMSRRLLQSLDCRHGSRLVITQEQLSGWLGVRRESVTVEAQKLQEAGLIRYSRGRITVLDRRGLEDRSCGCFNLANEEYRRLRPHPAREERLFAAAPADRRAAVPRRREPECASCA